MSETTNTTELQVTEAIKATCAPPYIRHRNQHGLIDDGSIKYVFNEQGFVDWRKMIKSEFLVPNKQCFERQNRPVPESIDGLADKELLILLGGIKDLAQIRGFMSVDYVVSAPTVDYVAAVCRITFLPNYETENNPVIFSAIGDASPYNTNGMGKNYLGPFAENRAFVRCVRNFLKINIVSQEEIGGDAANNNNPEDMATSLLLTTMNQLGVSFEKIKAKLIEEKVENAENFASIADIPRYKKFELIERMKRKAAQQAKA